MWMRSTKRKLYSCASSACRQKIDRAALSGYCIAWQNVMDNYSELPTCW